jgi:cytochrome c-type biogenesis protein CcmF
MGAAPPGRTDERWIVATRRWTLIAWTALGVGQLLGAPLGLRRGRLGRATTPGIPVENAALMPFLAATAFLHSVMIQEKRGMLKVWNVVLVALAFCLSLFGTFLTRSGVVNSIHSFSQSDIGPVVPRVHRDRGDLLDAPDHLAPAPAPLDDEARVARLA